MPAAIRAAHDTDPAENIRTAVGDLRGIDVFYNQVLVGIYVRPARTASGIMLPDRTRDEDLYQGKVGLVLKLGPMAFVDDEKNGIQFHNADVRVGDWVMFRPSDGWQLSLNRHACRVIADAHIKARLESPDLVW